MLFACYYRFTLCLYRCIIIALMSLRFRFPSFLTATLRDSLFQRLVHRTCWPGIPVWQPLSISTRTSRFLHVQREYNRFIKSLPFSSNQISVALLVLLPVFRSPRPLWEGRSVADAFCCQAVHGSLLRVTCKSLLRSSLALCSGVHLFCYYGSTNK